MDAMWTFTRKMWMQCGSTTSPHFECGCYVEQCDALWSNVDFHISNVNKCRYIVGQHNGDLRLFLDKFEINVDRHTKNVDPPHLHILTMWVHHISTFPQCGVSTPTHLTI